MYDFQTKTHEFRRLEWAEIRQLEKGDEIVICTYWNPPEEVHFKNAIVIRPVFWNSDADEPNWELETTNGFVDTYSIYEVIKF